MTLAQYTLARSGALFYLSASTPWKIGEFLPEPQFIIQGSKRQPVAVLNESGGGAQITLRSVHHTLRVTYWNRTPGPWVFRFTVPPWNP